MIRFTTLFIGAFLAVMIAIQEIAPYFITDMEFPQNELIITLGVAIGSLLVVVLPRVAMVVFLVLFIELISGSGPLHRLGIL